MQLAPPATGANYCVQKKHPKQLTHVGGEGTKALMGAVKKTRIPKLVARPVCGSPVNGDATASGIGIHFCSRCTWYQVRSADGRVAEEDEIRGNPAAA